MLSIKCLLLFPFSWIPLEITNRFPIRIPSLTDCSSRFATLLLTLLVYGYLYAICFSSKGSSIFISASVSLSFFLCFLCDSSLERNPSKMPTEKSVLRERLNLLSLSYACHCEPIKCWMKSSCGSPMHLCHFRTLYSLWPYR